MTTSTTQAMLALAGAEPAPKLPIGTMVKDEMLGRVGVVFDYGQEPDGTALYHLRARRSRFEPDPGAVVEWSCDARAVIVLTGWLGQSS